MAASYGWSDLGLVHGFHTTKQGKRYPLSEPARRTVPDRLVALDPQRHEEEVKAGLHNKSANNGERGKMGLFVAALRPRPFRKPTGGLFGS